MRKQNQKKLSLSRETVRKLATDNLTGAKGAAVLLGIPSTTLESRIKRLGIDKHRFRPAP